MFSILHSVWQKKVKASHTRYQALGLELIPVYRQLTPQVAVSHPPSSRLPLLSKRPAVTFSVAEHHKTITTPGRYQLILLGVRGHRCEQLVQGKGFPYSLPRHVCHE